VCVYDEAAYKFIMKQEMIRRIIQLNEQEERAIERIQGWTEISEDVWWLFSINFAPAFSYEMTMQAFRTTKKRQFFLLLQRKKH